MQCEAMIDLPEWTGKPPRQCSHSATHMAQGMALCKVHSDGRWPRVQIGDGMIEALREIAHGTSGMGPKTDLAVVQTIARKALGEIQT